MLKKTYRFLSEFGEHWIALVVMGFFTIGYVFGLYFRGDLV